MSVVAPRSVSPCAPCRTVGPGGTRGSATRRSAVVAHILKAINQGCNQDRPQPTSQLYCPLPDVPCHCAQPRFCRFLHQYHLAYCAPYNVSLVTGGAGRSAGLHDLTRYGHCSRSQGDVKNTLDAGPSAGSNGRKSRARGHVMPLPSKVCRP